MLDLVNARYKDPNLDPKERVDDLISYMTLEEKVAQMMCIWNGKREMLVDEQGNFDYEKAKQSFKHECFSICVNVFVFVMFQFLFEKTLNK